MAAEKSRILIIGATGYIGKFIAAASVRSRHPTFVLIREISAVDPAKAKIIGDFKDSGAIIVHGDLYNHESLVNAIKDVDVVISAVARDQLADQTKIITAIKEAGTIKRFIPSEFGSDVDRSNAVAPASSLFKIKAQIRREIEAENIPHTYVSSNLFSGYFLPSLAQATAHSLPTDKVFILGNGDAKAIFNREEDIATFTIKAVDDPRTLNKVLYLRPPANIYSHNDLVTLWEKKTGKSFQRVYISEDDFLKNIHDVFEVVNVVLAIYHSVFIRGEQTNFEIDPSVGVEATELYTEVKYTPVDEYMNRFL